MTSPRPSPLIHLLEVHDVGGEEVLYILSSIEVYKDEISFSKIVHAVFHQEVLGKAFLKVNSFFIFQVVIKGLFNLQFTLAETNSISHSVSYHSLLLYLSQ